MWIDITILIRGCAILTLLLKGHTSQSLSQSSACGFNGLNTLHPKADLNLYYHIADTKLYFIYT